MSRVRAAALSVLLLAAPVAGQQPAAPPAALRFANVDLSTGIRMHYGMQGESGSRTVILLHGYTDSSYSWTRVAPLLPESWRVFALDLRGHGDTEKPESGYTAQAMAADVVAFMDAMGVERATIVGHSGGGLIAQRVMLDAPERVERAVIMSSIAAGAHIVDYGPFIDAIMALSDPVDPAFARAFQESTVAQPVPAAFMDRVVAESLKLPARVWQAYAQGVLTAPVPEGLKSVRIPTMIIWGELDAIVPRVSQDVLLTIPGSKLVVHEGIGHAPHWEDPARAARDLIGFIGG